MSNMEARKTKGTDPADSFAELGADALGQYIGTAVAERVKGLTDHASGRAGVPLPAGYEPGDPVAMGRLGSDLHGFWTESGQVEILSSGELFREPGLAKLGSLQYWEKYSERATMGKCGGFKAKTMGQFMMEFSKRAGEIHARNVPGTVAPPELVQRQLLLAMVRAMPNPDTLAALLMTDPQWKGNVWRNVFVGRIEVTKSPPSGGNAGPWTDKHTKMLTRWLSQKYKINVKREMALEAVELIGLDDERHPVRDYLTGGEWDGVKRLDTWLTDYAGVEDNAYTRAVGAKTLIGLVARIMDPGCKFDTALIFESDQGFKKSTLIKSLSPNKEWYSNTVPGDLESKDAAIALHGKWINELAEGRLITKNSVEVVKNFLSTDTDNYRPPYGTLSEDFLRQCGFIGSINPKADGTYLRDTTGGRRFWPVKTQRADIDGLVAVRDQLWYEAVARYGDGTGKGVNETWWLNAKDEELAKVEQADRQESNVWVEHLEKFICSMPVYGDKNGLGWIDRSEPLLVASTVQVFEAIMGRAPGVGNKNDEMAIAEAFKSLGWKSVNRASIGGRRWVRDVPTKKPDPGKNGLF